MFFDLQNGQVSGKKTTGAKQRATVVLCANSNGYMLSPYIIFKGDPPKPPGATKIGRCFVTANKTAWMTEELMFDWLKKVFFMQSIPLRTRRVLVVDSFSVHIKPSIRKFMEERKVKYITIPGGLTHLLQPLDVSINKPIKDRVRIFYEEWFNKNMTDLTGITKSGMIRAPTKETLREWR